MKLYLGPVEISITQDSNIELDLFVSKYFINPILTPLLKFKSHYSVSKNFNHLSDFKLILDGISTDDTEMPYNWFILENRDQIAFKIEYFYDTQFKYITAVLNPKDGIFNVYLTPKSDISNIKADPLLHPLGSLLLVYLANLNGGFLIHASGIIDQNQGYIFSAVSGTGKSTMANIWNKAGADIVNDDRLWIQKINKIWYMMSTPMISYAQTPLITPIHKVFLIRQSPNNELQKIKGVNATMQVMSNCIQHFSTKQITNKHLDSILNFTSNTAIYDCGFKPDNEIIELIRITN